MAKKQKTFSPSQAAAATGYHAQWIYRLCQQGKIGTRIEIPDTEEHRYRISAKEISALKARKNQAFQQT